MLDGKPKSRPRGRSERVAESVRLAVITILMEKGATALTLEAVATQAEVNRTTLYRRWGDKSRLITWALLETVGVEVPYTDQGSVKEDLFFVLNRVNKFLGSPLARSILQIMTFDAETDAEVMTAIGDFWQSRLNRTLEVFERAIERGECPEDIDKNYLIEQLFGPIYLRHLIGRGAVSQAYIKRLIADTLENVLI